MGQACYSCQSPQLFQALWFVGFAGGATLVVSAFCLFGPFSPGLEKLPMVFSAAPQDRALGFIVWLLCLLIGGLVVGLNLLFLWQSCSNRQGQMQQQPRTGMCNPNCVYMPHPILDIFQVIGAVTLASIALAIIVPNAKLGVLTSALVMLIGAGTVSCGACCLIVVRQECCGGQGNSYGSGQGYDNYGGSGGDQYYDDR